MQTAKLPKSHFKEKNKCDLPPPFFLSALIALTSLPAYAVNWYSLGKSNDGSKELSIDLDSIRKHNNGSFQYLSVWEKLDFATTQKTNDGKLYRQSKHLVYIDCNNQKWQSVETIKYDSKGRVVESYNFQNLGLISTYSSANWNRVVPETMGEATVTTACYYANNK